MTQIKVNEIRLLSIKMISGRIDCSAEYAMQNPVINVMDTKFEADFRVNVESNTVNYFLNIKLEALDANLKPMPITAEYSLNFVYEIGNLKDYIVEQGPAGIVVDHAIAATLMGMTFSTARGMILCRTEGTILNGVILPVVDPQDLIAHKRKDKNPINPSTVK